MPLGGGSYGVVLKAAKGWRTYAIKAVINEGNESPEDFMLKFRLEAEILRRVNHPRIPGLVEAFSLEDVHYLVQEYVGGLPLSHLLHTGRRFNEKEVKGIIYQLLAILNELHNPPRKQDAVVHRDLRLSNLMLSDGKLYLIDFGLARFIDSRQFPFCPDPLQKKFGSAPNYKDRSYNCAPALRHIPGHFTYQLLRREISPRSDLFGAGVAAVDLFTNWVEDEALFKRSWKEVLPLSEPFKDFVEKLLSREGFASSAEAQAYLSRI
ncbi:protein kinase domain-containing protein [Desulfolucanica intricata]|uniref:protein kinase domain-containing protein n=1 Tax=Desulfolucanica intricata TaxID=1285191 RepID=UPI0008379957|nr:protein kinase [Desulfolucanica intricata]